ncbi:hypothetical protein PoB_000170100 [Plakobranchus ocellatus]|uniref:Uncharacterized protein n=1 Tax=Plakobranchus ocellatus TaxID=259542 RepID=A0AAV3XWK6_9GAST|nr:hypothetical protein PoB_000170100 [Plakobranchus ocellatus]
MTSQEPQQMSHKPPQTLTRMCVVRVGHLASSNSVLPGEALHLPALLTSGKAWHTQTTKRLTASNSFSDIKVITVNGRGCKSNTLYNKQVRHYGYRGKDTTKSKCDTVAIKVKTLQQASATLWL